MSQRDTLLGWLKDAHSMEKGLVPVLQNHTNDAADMPEIAARLAQHLEETKRHEELVHGCIESLGGDTSVVKDAMGAVIGAVNSVTSAPFADEPVKNFLSDYAAEQFEVASYTSLIAAARELGETQVAEVCEQILAEDLAMAQWLHEHIPTVTTMFLSHEAVAA